MAVVDTYAVANYNSSFIFETGTYGYCQSFTGDGSTLDSASLYMRRFGNPTGNITIKIYAHSGTFGTNSLPTGAALATAVFAASAQPTTRAMVTYPFTGTNRITLGNGTKYVLAAEHSGSDFTSNWLDVGVDTTTPSHAGSYGYMDDTNTWFSVADRDLIFTINGSTSQGSMLPMFM